LLCVIHPDGLECTTKTSMETTCLEENQRRFHQADDTPLVTNPLFALVGPLGNGPACQEILQGQFQHPDVDPVVLDTLNSLAMPASSPPFDPVWITVADYQAIWRRSDERTSSCPYHALHFGHYIALSRDEELATLHTKMVDITLMSGYSPARWRIGLNVMIPKKLGDFRVEQLRTILLYDAEFNALLKWLGRLLMARAEELQVLAPEQYGSRHGLSAIYQSLNMQLTFDIIRQWRIPAAVCSNDAKACYDRIVHAFASLAIQRLGVPIGPIQVMFTTIQQLQHHIRTIHGDSEISFSALSSTVPIQGVGQGNGAGPQIWAVVSSPIFNMVRAHGLGATFCSNVTKADLHLVGFGFVDDVDLVVADSLHPTTSSQIVSKLQQTLDLWEKGLCTSGGALSAAKSRWTLMDFGWKQGKWFYRSVSDAPGQLFMNDVSGQRIQLDRLESWEAERSLGIRLAPDGNMRTELAYRVQQALTWANHMRQHHAPRHANWVNLTRVLLKQLEYPLMATTFTPQECD